MEKFKVEYAKPCFSKKDGSFVSIYVTDQPLSEDAAYEVIGKGAKAEFWIEPKEEDKISGRKMQYIYPKTEAWKAFKPFWKVFLSEEQRENMPQ